jgi:nucleoside-diphosphate kinase
MTERTLVVLKPDAVQRGIVGDVITRFERVGLKIVGAKMLTVTKEMANQHYPTDRKPFIVGMGNKTLDNYKEQGIDPVKELGTDDPEKIGLMVQNWLVDFITSGPVLAFVLEGPHAVELVRKICGHTLPAKAQPGTIRGDYSFDSSALANQGRRPIRNLIHASGELEEAEYEIGLWFSESELHSYDTIHHKHMMG